MAYVSVYVFPSRWSWLPCSPARLVKSGSCVGFGLTLLTFPPLARIHMQCRETTGGLGQLLHAREVALHYITLVPGNDGFHGVLTPRVEHPDDPGPLEYTFVQIDGLIFSSMHLRIRRAPCYQDSYTTVHTSTCAVLRKIRLELAEQIL